MKFTEQPILIVGDVMLDEYIYGKVTRISPEAPVPVVKYEQSEYRLGGAANTAANISSLGGNPVLIGAVGSDISADRLLTLMQSHDICIDYISSMRKISKEMVQTTVKSRLIANGQQIARIDRENNNNWPNLQLHKHITASIESAINKSKPAAIIVSDYAKCVISQEVIDMIAQNSRDYKIPVFIDPKTSNADFYKRNWHNTIMTPNLQEALELTHGILANGDGISGDIDAMGRYIVIRYGCRHVLITRGDEGMTLFSDSKSGLSADIHSVDIPSTAKDVFDVSGAGDTVIAVLALAIASGWSIEDSAHLANTAAGIVVGKRGTATVSANELEMALSQNNA